MRTMREYATAAAFVLAIVAMIACVVAGLTGCATVDWIKDHGGGAVTNVVPPVVTPPAQTTLSDDLDLSAVVWHGPDIRTWKITADLKAGIRGGEITLATDILKGKKESGDNGTSGNPWAIAKGTDGKLHAYTYEWISYSRQSRSLWKAFDRGHGCPSVCTNSGVKDAVFYVAVATVSRGVGGRNGDERTPFRKVVHP